MYEPNENSHNRKKTVT